MEGILATTPTREPFFGEVTAQSVSFETYLSKFEAFLLERLQIFEEDVRELARSSLSLSGKRIRPALVHACRDDAFESAEDLVKGGAIVEFVHVATLVHDDVLDDATIRRGRRSIYSSHGATAAILLGDALFAHALEMASEFPGSNVCRWVAAATRKTCAGEIRQSFLSGDYSLALGEYREIIEAKTAELFRVSCFLGANLSNRDDVTCKLLGEFGRRLGVTYQIFDDLADVFGQEQTLGKTLGRDLAHGKVTLPTIKLLAKLPQSKSAALLESLRHSIPEANKEAILKVHELLERYDVLDDCSDFLIQELEAVGSILEKLEDDVLAARLEEFRMVILARLQTLGNA